MQSILCWLLARRQTTCTVGNTGDAINGQKRWNKPPQLDKMISNERLQQDRNISSCTTFNHTHKCRLHGICMDSICIAVSSAEPKFVFLCLLYRIPRPISIASYFYYYIPVKMSFGLTKNTKISWLSWMSVCYVSVQFVCGRRGLCCGCTMAWVIDHWNAEKGAVSSLPSSTVEHSCIFFAYFIWINVELVRTENWENGKTKAENKLDELAYI